MLLLWLPQVHAGSGGHVGFPTIQDLFLPVEVCLPSVSHCAHLSHCRRDGHQPARIQRLGGRAGQSVCVCVCVCVCFQLSSFQVEVLLFSFCNFLDLAVDSSFLSLDR